MALDVQTLYFLGVPVAIIAAAMVWLFGRWVPDAKGTTTWALATLCFGSIGILYAGRSSLPFFLTVVVGNTLYVTSAALYHLAACRIRNASYPALFHIAIIVFIVVSFEFIFTDIKSDYVARVLIVCPLLVIQYFLTARTLLVDRQTVSREEYLVLVFGAMPFILLGLGLIWRTVIHLPGVTIPPDDLLSNDANNVITKITFLLSMVFFPFVFIQMNNVISHQRLQLSEGELRRLNEELEQRVEARTEELKSTVVQLGEEITERQQAELGIKKLNEELEQRVNERTIELETQRRLLETVLTNLPAGVGLYRGPDYIVELVNHAYKTIAPGKDIIGRAYKEVWPEVYSHVGPLLQHVLETGQPYHAIDEKFLFRRSPDGPLETAYFSWSLIRVLLPGEAGWGVLNTVIETTERVQAVEALRESEERLRLAQQVARIGSFEWDIEKNMTVWSPELEELHGLQPGTYVGRYEDWAALVHPDDLPAVERRLRESMDTGLFEMEWRIVRPDGSIRWLAARGQVFKDAAGKPLRMVGVNLDITARKQAEEALRETTRRFQTIVDHAPIAIYVKNRDGRFVFGNRKLEQYTGHPLEGLLGMTDYDFAPKEDADRWRENDLKVLKGQPAEYEETGTDRNGRTYVNISLKFPLSDESGTPVEVCGISMDITQRKLAEKALRQRTAELEFANRELESFSYSVSHDLKTPLRAIEGFSQMLASEHAAKLDAEGHRLLKVITDNTELMNTLVDDLLALSRLGRQAIKKRSVNLAAIAGQVFERLQAQTPERDLQLTIGDLPQGFGDRSLLSHVLENLLANAIKFTKTRKPAVIEVGGRDEENETVYFVKDNGVGFDERYADKLFSVFQRLHKPTEYEGTGVGLAIVQRIIQRHGGRVWAEGKVNEGATFYFSLPKHVDLPFSGEQTN